MYTRGNLLLFRINITYMLHQVVCLTKENFISLTDYWLPEDVNRDNRFIFFNRIVFELVVTK